MPRTLRRHIRELTLLTAIVFGGLLSPLSHLVYMSLSDVHSLEMRHGDASAESLVAHIASNGIIGSRIAAQNEEHYECPYLVLFATPLIGDSNDSDTAFHGFDPVEIRDLFIDTPRPPVSFSSHEVRGPPQVDPTT